MNKIFVILILLLCSSCSFLKERDALVVSFNETEKMQYLVGKSKDEILDLCGKPKEIAKDVVLNEAKYDERWRYNHACGLVKRIADPYYFQLMFFVDDHLAEISVFVH